MTNAKTKLCEYCEEREVEEGKITTKYRVCSKCKYGVYAYVFDMLKTAAPHHKWKGYDLVEPFPFYSKTAPGLIVIYNPEKRRWWARFRLLASEDDAGIKGEYKCQRFSKNVAAAIHEVTSNVLNKISNKLGLEVMVEVSDG